MLKATLRLAAFSCCSCGLPVSARGLVGFSWLACADGVSVVDVDLHAAAGGVVPLARCGASRTAAGASLQCQQQRVLAVVSAVRRHARAGACPESLAGHR